MNQHCQRRIMAGVNCALINMRMNYSYATLITDPITNLYMRSVFFFRFIQTLPVFDRPYVRWLTCERVNANNGIISTRASSASPPKPNPSETFPIFSFSWRTATDREPRLRRLTHFWTSAPRLRFSLAHGLNGLNTRVALSETGAFVSLGFSLRRASGSG